KSVMKAIEQFIYDKCRMARLFRKESLMVMTDILGVIRVVRRVKYCCQHIQIRCRNADFTTRSQNSITFLNHKYSFIEADMFDHMLRENIIETTVSEWKSNSSI